MRVIKLGLISFVVFSLLITFISFLFPSRVRISKAIDIRTERKVVMEQLNDTGNWKNWYPGADSAMLLPLITTVTDSSVLANTTLMKGRKGISGWNIYEASVPGMVTVQWYMDFHLRWYPWEKFSSLLLEKKFGSMMEQGLTNLKSQLEK